MRSKGLELVHKLLVMQVVLGAQVGSSSRAVATAGAPRSQSAEAAAALGPGLQLEDTGAGHLRRAFKGTLWEALGCGHFKRRLTRLLGLLAGHPGGNSVNLKPRFLWICEIVGHCFSLWD